MNLLRHWKKVVLAVILAWSVLGLFLSPFGDTKEKVFDRGPWVLVGVVLAEVLFVVGLLMMAAAIGIEVRNVRFLRKNIKRILRSAVSTPLFWAGFWLNAVGAIGDAVVLAIGVGATLPIESWGLIVLPSLDFFATITLRAAVIKWSQQPADMQGSVGES